MQAKDWLYLAGSVAAFLLFYWRVAKVVAVWELELSQVKEKQSVLDEKVDELIVRVALLDDRILRGVATEKK